MIWWTSHPQYAGLWIYSSGAAPEGVGGVKYLCFGTRECILAGLREQLLRWKILWPHISPLPWASALKKGQRRTLVTAEVLKTASNPKAELPWINHCLWGSYRATQQTTGQQLCRSGLSNCMYPSQISGNPTGIRSGYMSEENRAPLLPAASILCRGASSSKTKTWWGLWARGSTSVGHLSAHYNL